MLSGRFNHHSPAKNTSHLHGSRTATIVGFNNLGVVESMDLLASINSIECPYRGMDKK